MIGLINKPLRYQLKIAMILTKDTEKILIGSDIGIESHLRGGEDDEFLMEWERPLGSLLYNLEHDDKAEWNIAVTYLFDAYEKKFRRFSNFSDPCDDFKTCGEYLDEAKKILQKKLEKDDPITKYVALKLWYELQQIFDTRGKQYREFWFENVFRNHAIGLVRPFGMEKKSFEVEATPVLPDGILFRWPAEFTRSDREMVIVKPSKKISNEYVCAGWSLLPLKNYYIHKFEIWKKYLLQCKICNKYFIASNLHYEYCSNQCRTTAKEIALTKRKIVPSVHNVDKLCKREYQYWYSRWKTIQDSQIWTEDCKEEFRQRMEKFQEEKVEKRKQHSAGNLSYKDLLNWFAEQRKVVDALMGDN